MRRNGEELRGGIFAVGRDGDADEVRGVTTMPLAWAQYFMPSRRNSSRRAKSDSHCLDERRISIPHCGSYIECAVDPSAFAQRTRITGINDKRIFFVFTYLVRPSDSVRLILVLTPVVHIAIYVKQSEIIRFFAADGPCPVL